MQDLNQLATLIQSRLKENLRVESIEIVLKNSEDVDNVIRMLQEKFLRLSDIIIKVGDDVADVFISKFVDMSPKPTILKLSLPSIKLTHQSWEKFFKGLEGFESLKVLSMQDSNFSCRDDLTYLGSYLKKNPQLRIIDIRHITRLVANIFLQGEHEVELRDSLKNNTNLTQFNYGTVAGSLNQINLSKKIKKILDDNLSNKSAIPDEDIICQTLTKLNEEQYLANIEGRLDDFVKKFLAQPVNPAPNPLRPVNLKSFKSLLNDLNNDYEIAKHDKAFNASERGKKIQNTRMYYVSLLRLIDALDKMSQQELNASEQDRRILHNLGEDFFKSWQFAASKQDPTERNTEMGKMFEQMKSNCIQARIQVKDKKGSALIKNILLIVSAILTLGLSLGIYAAVTKQSRAQRGSFFFKDTEVSKNAIDEVHDKVEGFNSLLNKQDTK